MVAVMSVLCCFALVSCGQKQIGSNTDAAKKPTQPTRMSEKKVNRPIKNTDEKSNIDDVDVALFQQLKQSSGKTDAEVFELMGMNYYKQEQKDKAVLYLKRAIELNPDLFGPWFTLGLLHMNTPQSYAFFRKSIELNPDYAPAYYWFAVSFFNNKAYKEAAMFFTRYVALAKDDPNEATRYKNAQAILEKMQPGN